MKKFHTAALLLAAAICCCGCQSVATLNNGVHTKQTTKTFTYYNGETIDGVPAAQTTVKPPLEIPSVTGTHTGTDISGKPNGTTTEGTTTEPQTEAPPESSIEQTSVQTTAAPQTETEATTVTAPPQTPAPTEAVTTAAPPQTSAETTTVTRAPQTPAPTAAEVPQTPKPTENQVPSPEDLPYNSYNALNHSEVKGLWITYFELYPILTGKSKDEFEAGIGRYLDNALSLGLNTVYVHVRPYGDAVYNSDVYPWSKYCTGYIGQAPDFDPLPVIIQQAHKRNISVQAWINPLRCYHQDDAEQLDDSYITKQWINSGSGKQIVKIDNYWYLDPAYDEVTDLIARGAAEIVAKYDVDGVHIDDYFYPTTESYFDAEAFAASGYDSLARFRLDNCSKMVAKMYAAIKSHNPTAVFGVSSQGNVTNNREVLYADVERWCAEDGFVDYMAPQIYYGFDNDGQPYSEVVEQWDDMLRGTGKALIPGLAVYKIGNEDAWAGTGRYEWMTDTEILKRQTEKAQTADTYGGIILYSYQFIFEPDSGVSQAVYNEIEALRPLLE